MARKPNDDGTIVLEDVEIGFRNFSGQVGKYNKEGEKSFVVFMNDDIATRLADDGWNVKYLKPLDEEDSPQAYLSVSVNYGTRGRPPKVVLVTSRGKTVLTADTVSLVDWAEIVKADCIIRPYHWEVNENTGIKAYLRDLYLTIREDPLELKYADVPPSAMSEITSEAE